MAGDKPKQQVTFSDGNVVTIIPKDSGGCVVAHSNGQSNSCWWVRKCLEQAGFKSRDSADVGTLASDSYDDNAQRVGAQIEQWKEHGFPEIKQAKPAIQDEVTFSDALRRKLEGGKGSGGGDNGPGGPL